MFRQAFLSSLLLIAIVLTTIYIFLIRIRPEEVSSYRKLTAASAELRSRKALEREPANQLRQGVQKDIWIANERQRLHFRFKSEKSHLALTQKKGKISAVEKLKQIECLIQEAVDPASSIQKLRMFRANEGTYYFPSHRFSANHIDLAFYQIPGIDLPSFLPLEKPFLTGTAQTITFSAADKNPAFTAHFLKIHLDPLKGRQ